MAEQSTEKATVDEAAISRIADRIVEEFHPERIILFGSHAYGRPSWESDLDLLVIMETDLRPAERSSLIARKCRPRYVAMDILVRTPREMAERLDGFDPFLEEVLSHGRVLYDAAR